MAIEPLPPVNWVAQTEVALKDAGMESGTKGTALLAWSQIFQHGNIHYSDGYYLNRLWLAPGRYALGVTSRRIYFLDNGAQIDNRPERVVLSGASRPKSPNAAELAKTQWDLIGKLRERFQHQTRVVELAPLDINFKEALKVQISGNTFSIPSAGLNQLYKEHGFDKVPREFTISLCPLESVSGNTINEFEIRFRKLAKRRNLDLVIKKTSPTAISRRIKTIFDKQEAARAGHCVLFVLPLKEQEPREETLLLFEAMEKNKIPFRRAYENDPLDFSIPDQFPSLVLAAGGIPHRSRTEVSGIPIWMIGIDLSHRKDKKISVLALTLLNPDGELVGTWKKLQPLDETVRKETIEPLLRHCKEKLATYKNDKKIVVLRDGRMFKNDDSKLYRNILDTDVSLFEYRKRNNPQIILKKKPDLPSDPIITIVPGTLTMFVTTRPSIKENTFSHVSKVTWREEWNGLGLSPVQVGKLLAVSTIAPGLGLKSSYPPAPIYWADGLAGTNNEDLRFRGIPATWVD